MSDVVIPAVAPVTATPAEAPKAPAAPDLMQMSGKELVEYYKNQKPEDKKVEPKKEVKAPAAKKELAPGETENLTPSEIRKHKLKIDGEEIEVDDEELKRGYQKSKSSNQRYLAAEKLKQEAAADKKQAHSILSRLKEDPSSLVDIMKQLGHDDARIRDMAEQYVWGQMQQDNKSPEQIEYENLKQFKASKDDEDNQVKQRQQAERETAQRNKLAQDYQVRIQDALEKTNIPKTKQSVQEMAKYMRDAIKANEPITELEAAKLVEEDIQDRLMQVISNSDAAAILKRFGPEIAKKIREHDIAQIRNPNNFNKTPAREDQPIERTGKNGRRMSSAEWQNEIAKKYKK